LLGGLRLSLVTRLSPLGYRHHGRAMEAPLPVSGSEKHTTDDSREMGGGLPGGRRCETQARNAGQAGQHGCVALFSAYWPSASASLRQAESARQSWWGRGAHQEQSLVGNIQGHPARELAVDPPHTTTRLSLCLSPCDCSGL